MRAFFPVAAAVAALTISAASAADAAIMTTTWTTTIESVGAVPDFAPDPLVGTSFQLRMTYDTELGSTIHYDDAGLAYTTLLPRNSQPVLAASVTYGGQTFDFDLSDMDFGLSQGNNRGLGFFNSYLALNTGAGVGSYVVINLETTLGDEAPLDMTTPFTSPMAASGFFDFVSPDREFRLRFSNTLNTPGQVTVTRDTAAVPEPATWALMIGGFGLAGVTLRRRRLAAS